MANRRVNANNQDGGNLHEINAAIPQPVNQNNNFAELNIRGGVGHINFDRFDILKGLEGASLYIEIIPVNKPIFMDQNTSVINLTNVNLTLTNAERGLIVIHPHEEYVNLQGEANFIMHSENQGM